MNIQKRFNPALLLGLFVAFAAGGAEAKTTRVKVVGEAGAVEGDRAASETAAKRAARRKAVEEGAGIALESNTIVRNFQVVKDEIAASAKGVLTDEQWGPLKIADGVASIELTASVSPEAIDGAVCGIVKANSDPRIAIIFVEKSGDESQPWVAAQAERGPIEAMFTDAFMENCFTIVEPGVKVTEVAANGDLPQETIQAIVKNAKAQYVLLGQGKIVKADKAKTPAEKSRMNVYTIGANVRLLNTETNVVEAVASSSKTVLGISPDHALKAMSNKDTGKRALTEDVMDPLFEKIAARWSNDLVNSNVIAVTVQGVKNFQASTDFRSGVESQLKGAKARQRTLKSGVAEIEVEFEGGAEAFATAVDQKKFGKVKVEVLEVAPGKVVLQLN
jgi:uncharacterized protein